MSIIDRRNFVKSLSVAAGAATLAGATPVIAQSSGTKVNSTKSSLSNMLVPFDLPRAMTFFNHRLCDVMAINYYVWAIRAKNGETTLVDTGTGKSGGRS